MVQRGVDQCSLRTDDLGLVLWDLLQSCILQSRRLLPVEYLCIWPALSCPLQVRGAQGLIVPHTGLGLEVLTNAEWLLNLLSNPCYWVLFGQYVLVQLCPCLRSSLLLLRTSTDLLRSPLDLGGQIHWPLWVSVLVEETWSWLDHWELMPVSVLLANHLLSLLGDSSTNRLINVIIPECSSCGERLGYEFVLGQLLGLSLLTADEFRDLNIDDACAHCFKKLIVGRCHWQVFLGTWGTHGILRKRILDLDASSESWSQVLVSSDLLCNLLA